jgi:hypothetical protein
MLHLGQVSMEILLSLWYLLLNVRIKEQKSMKWKSRFLPVFLIVAGITVPVLSLAAQSNQLIDGYLGEKAATFGESVYIVLAATGAIADTATPEEAIAALQQKTWGVRIQKAEEPITLGDFAHLVMKALDMGGGLMYLIAPGPRYASRELTYQGIIKGDPSPSRTLSGREALSILRGTMEWKGQE